MGKPSVRVPEGCCREAHHGEPHQDARDAVHALEVVRAGAGRAQPRRRAAPRGARPRDPSFCSTVSVAVQGIVAVETDRRFCTSSSGRTADAASFCMLLMMLPPSSPSLGPSVSGSKEAFGRRLRRRQRRRCRAGTGTSTDIGSRRRRQGMRRRQIAVIVVVVVVVMMMMVRVGSNGTCARRQPCIGARVGNRRYRDNQRPVLVVIFFVEKLVVVLPVVVIAAVNVLRSKEEACPCAGRLMRGPVPPLPHGCHERINVRPAAKHGLIVS
jgi:hypothetical protein